MRYDFVQSYALATPVPTSSTGAAATPGCPRVLACCGHSQCARRTSARGIDDAAVEHRDISVADAHALSIETINLLVKENPKFVGRLIADAGKRRRGELAYPLTSLKPIARFILLAGMNRRAEKLSEADALFLDNYLEEIGAT